MRHYKTITAGEDKTLSLVAHDPPDSGVTADIFDLTGATIEVDIIDTRNGVTVKTCDGTITDATAGEYTISLTDADTDGWSGKYRGICKATVSGTTTKIGTLRLAVEAAGIPALADYGR